MPRPLNHDRPQDATIEIEAPGRLHMGFLDISGSIGRRFGSLGVGLEEIVTHIRLRAADRLEVFGPDAARARPAAEAITGSLGLELPAHIDILKAIPHHAGLGSGTQMALAVGTGLAALHQIDLSLEDIATTTRRGARSGIGIAAFRESGLILDGGRGPETLVPPVISRLQMPPAWRFLIILDPHHQGLHGTPEMNAFSLLPPFPEDDAARLCHRLLMEGLPAVMEHQLKDFGDVVSELQRAVGDHFAPAQGGRFASRDVADTLNFLEAEGAVGIGQSSWGPTGFCLVANEEHALALKASCEKALPQAQKLTISIGTPRRRGAIIKTQGALV